MRFIHYLYIVPLALLTACSSSDTIGDTTVTDHSNGEILLSAGIVEGATMRGAEDNHDNHQTLTSNTKLALQVSGTWTGHETGTIVKTTTATVGAATGSDNRHNNVSCDPVLYWDDYGTADPANTSGRNAGLTIYGAAINGKAAPSVDNWTALDWTLSKNQTASGETPADKDLLISNNVKEGGADGTYKFDNRNSGKLLEFRHALSKITVILTAGEGFVSSKFASAPEVILTSNEGTPADANAWPLTTGKVDITTGVVTSQATKQAVTMNTASEGSLNVVTKEALVMPGSPFKKDAIIARVNADGNIYYVTSEKIRKAINSVDHNEDDLTESGKNYIINVIVNKTKIDVTATVTNWVPVNAEEVAPKINITVGYGIPGTTVRVNTFSFYRSLALNDGYATGESENLEINGFYKRVSELTKNNDDTWTMNPVRYWSDHNQHYQFRLVWPNTTTALKTATENPDVSGETVVQKWRPHVEDKTHDGTNYQVIEIWNDPYQDVLPEKTMIADDYHPYPSNLAIARPEIFDDPATTDVNEQLCKNDEPGHTRTNLYTGGICATEGNIDLSFRFVMSQVEVYLTTTSDASKVELNNAKVELVNVHKTGDVKLGDREVIPTGTIVDYKLDNYSYDSETKKVHYHSAIVPQELTYTTAQAADNVKFRITITNSDGTTDVYYADIAPILESGKTTKVAPNGVWESGYHYVYNLNVSKTVIKVTATLANWTKVDASQDIWF